MNRLSHAQLSLYHPCKVSNDIMQCMDVILRRIIQCTDVRCEYNKFFIKHDTGVLLDLVDGLDGHSNNADTVNDC